MATLSTSASMYEAPSGRTPASSRTVFPTKLNAYFLSLIDHPGDPLGRQVLPDPRESEDTGGTIDPLDEVRQSPTSQIIHRYPHRVIFLVSARCAVNCRFCMRKRIAGDRETISQQSIDRALAYIVGNRSISEVILSGGDPLMLDDDELVAILEALRGIDHVSVIRIHTRIPGVWPQKVTKGLARRLASFHPLYINLHFNHSREITTESALACSRLADAGLPLGSQTVLLQGVNDHPDVLADLFTKLLEIRVRPYYLHQIDRVPGTAHFQVPLKEGLQIVTALHGRLSGMAIPHFMIDLPGGGGKVELLPDSIEKSVSGTYQVRNFEGRIYSYPMD